MKFGEVKRLARHIYKWLFSVRKQISECNLGNCSDINVHISKSYIVEGIQTYMKNKFIADLYENINRATSSSGRSGNKLRDDCKCK